jgi:hypothetical protein
MVRGFHHSSRRLFHCNVTAHPTAVWTSEQGTPQGAVASPLLADAYLHYVFDLWAVRWRNRHSQGDLIIVRYADDSAPRDRMRTTLQPLKNELRQWMRQPLHEQGTRLGQVVRGYFAYHAIRPTPTA